MAGSSSIGSGRKLALLAAASCLAGSAGAAMPGLYFAGFYMDSTLAYSTVDSGLAGFDSNIQAIWTGSGFDVEDWQSQISDRTDIGYAFSVGYQLSQYFAAEIGYQDMGTVHYQASGIVSDVGGSYQSDTFASAKSKGPVLSGIAIWPMGDRISLDARAGAFFGRTRVRASAYIDSFYIGDASDKVNSTTFLLGAGVNWAMSPGMAIRAGYSRISKAMISEYDVSAWMLSLKYAW
jgi:opacity protein-like surface antigen